MLQQPKFGSCFTPVYISLLLDSVKPRLLGAHSGKDLVFVICTTVASKGHQRDHIPSFPTQGFEAQDCLLSAGRPFGLPFGPPPWRRSWRQDVPGVLALTSVITRSLCCSFKPPPSHHFPPLCFSQQWCRGTACTTLHLHAIYLVTQAEPVCTR